jgi:hypothetical protein
MYIIKSSLESYWTLFWTYDRNQNRRTRDPTEHTQDFCLLKICHTLRGILEKECDIITVALDGRKWLPSFSSTCDPLHGPQSCSYEKKNPKTFIRNQTPGLKSVNLLNELYVCVHVWRGKRDVDIWWLKMTNNSRLENNFPFGIWDLAIRFLFPLSYAGAAFV